LWGVGPRTEQALERLGLLTIGDVADTPLDTLRRALGAAAGGHLHALAAGTDERTVNPDGGERSISAEETFPVDTTDVAVVVRELLRLSERVGRRLRERERVAATIGVKIRYADFTTVTRSKTLSEPTDVTQMIYVTARSLARAVVGDGRAVRLVGVRAERLRPAGDAAHQLRFDEPVSGWSDLDRAVDDASRRFGPGALRPAALLTTEARRQSGRAAASGASGSSRANGSSGGLDGQAVRRSASRPSPVTGMRDPWSGHDGG
nr:hypothetical protein [Micromonospora sp. DSM 115978]